MYRRQLTILILRFLPVFVGILFLATSCAQSGDRQNSITIYSGRNERLVGPILNRFAEETGINVRIRYGDTSELAATILEEGNNSPADVFFAQDAGALGALAKVGKLRKLGQEILASVDKKFESPSGEWVGVSGRARVLAYNTQIVQETELPDTVLGLTDAKWKGKIGWAPTNGSFQAFVTALRITEGNEGAKRWLEGMKRNEPKVYSDNISIVDAVGKGEVSIGLVNHYYLYQFMSQRGSSFPVRNYYPRAGGPGAMINVAGAGILNTSKSPQLAERFIRFLLGQEAQSFFSEETSEYPLARGVSAKPELPPLAQIKAPDIDLGELADLQGTLRLLQEVGIL